MQNCALPLHGYGMDRAVSRSPVSLNGAEMDRCRHWARPSRQCTKQASALMPGQAQDLNRDRCGPRLRPLPFVLTALLRRNPLPGLPHVGRAAFTRSTGFPKASSGGTAGSHGIACRCAACVTGRRSEPLGRAPHTGAGRTRICSRASLARLYRFKPVEWSGAHDLSELSRVWLYHFQVVTG